ncbi:hypothetical protein Adt_05077 [Abeliophyllum distichum]|uniref:Uncharacterized protein n=1 Tax=Abeliophyllum distichum TaxID=126358 RepID=A0ABD1V3G2_9LAMI
MDIDDRHFDDLDLDDEADNHLPKVSKILMRLWLSPVMILQKGEMVIEEVGDVLPSLPPVVEVGNDSSSFSPVVEVGDDSSSLPLKASMSLPVDVQHQDKGKCVIIDEGEKVTPKRALEEEGVVVDLGRVKRS